jgi:hypothetical protein
MNSPSIGVPAVASSEPLPMPNPKSSRAASARPESERIGLLLRRDGYDASRAWVERTVQIYEAALAHPQSHASDPFYRPLFERAVGEFHDWLSTAAAGGVRA